MTVCIWCKDPAEDKKFWVSFVGRAIPLCPECHTLIKQFTLRANQIKDALHQGGIHIGIPRNDSGVREEAHHG